VELQNLLPWLHRGTCGWWNVLRVQRQTPITITITITTTITITITTLGRKLLVQRWTMLRRLRQTNQVSVRGIM